MGMNAVPIWQAVPTVASVCTVVIIAAYTSALWGDRALVRWMLAHVLLLIPVLGAMAVGMTSTDPAVVADVYRVGVAAVPLSAVAAIRYQYVLSGTPSSRFLHSLTVVGAALAVVTVGSPLVVAGVQRLGWGWFPRPGAAAVLGIGGVFAMVVVGFVPLARAALVPTPSPLRRQLRRTLIANSLTVLGLADLRLAYGRGALPVALLFVPIGCVLALRALLLEDVLRVRAVDMRLPRLVATWLVATMLGWFVLTLLGPAQAGWTNALALVLVYVAVRVAISLLGVVNRGGHVHSGPLERLLQHFDARSFAMETPEAVAQLGQEVGSIGTGATFSIWLARQHDWGWQDADGVAIDDHEAIDPLLASYLQDQNTRVVDAHTQVPPELFSALTALRARAPAIVLLVARGTLYGVAWVDVPIARRHTRRFVLELAHHIGEALAYVHVHTQALALGAAARDGALTRAVWASLMPNQEEARIDAVAIAGQWAPASSCGGDYWMARALLPVVSAGAAQSSPAAEKALAPAEPAMLLVVGDVSGHGVPAAMVTAAVSGACTALAEACGADLALPHLLDELAQVVANAGGGQLHMTCFAAILRATSITFVNAGHTAPYLAHPAAATGPLAADVQAVRAADLTTGRADRALATPPWKLAALTGRHNPLGMAQRGPWRVQHQPVAPGAVLVAFTDGLFDSRAPNGETFGERRLQRLVRALPAQTPPRALVAFIQAAVNAHRAEAPLADDAMVVVARWQATQH